MDLRLILNRQNTFARELESARQDLQSLLEQVSELNLRTQFIMRSTILKKKNTGIVTVENPEWLMTNMFAEYMTGGRESFLDRLEAELRAIEADVAKEGAHETETDPDADPDAATPLSAAQRGDPVH